VEEPDETAGALLALLWRARVESCSGRAALLGIIIGVNSLYGLHEDASSLCVALFHFPDRKLSSLYGLPSIFGT